MRGRRALLWAGMLLLCAGCGSHTPAVRSAQTIADCLQRTQPAMVGSIPVNPVVAQRVRPGPSAKPGPKPIYLVNGAEGGVVFVYASADAARSAFRDGALYQTSALGSNVVAIYVPFRGAPAGARRDLFRCAFGPKLTPVLKTPRPPRTGREVFADAGCLACHRLGTEGNDGPGPDLSNVGRQLSRQAIVGALASPAPPMPSFRFLPRAQFQALVDYLHQLRGGGGR